MNHVLMVAYVMDKKSHKPWTNDCTCHGQKATQGVIHENTFDSCTMSRKKSCTSPKLHNVADVGPSVRPSVCMSVNKICQKVFNRTTSVLVETFLLTHGLGDSVLKKAPWGKRGPGGGRGGGGGQ